MSSLSTKDRDLIRHQGGRDLMAATFSDDGFDDEIGWRRQNDDVHSIDRVGSDDPRRRRHKSPSEKTVDNI